MRLARIPTCQSRIRSTVWSALSARCASSGSGHALYRALRSTKKIGPASYCQRKPNILCCAQRISKDIEEISPEAKVVVALSSLCYKVPNARTCVDEDFQTLRSAPSFLTPHRSKPLKAAQFVAERPNPNDLAQSDSQLADEIPTPTLPLTPIVRQPAIWLRQCRSPSHACRPNLESTCRRVCTGGIGRSRQGR
jgi:hypothetical protein